MEKQVERANVAQPEEYKIPSILERLKEASSSDLFQKAQYRYQACSKTEEYMNEIQEINAKKNTQTQNVNEYFVPNKVSEG